MPKPKKSTYPKHERWRWVQRAIQEDELFAFAASIVASDGRRVDECLQQLLRFLDPDTDDIGVLKSDYWLALWLNIMHQMGIGYTSDNGSYVHATELGRFLVNTRNIRAYYYFWALRFQYPFTYPKHSHYVKNGVAVQPIVLMLQYLHELFHRSEDLRESYLTMDEVAAFLMRSRDNSQTQIDINCSQILENRTDEHDYEEEEQRNPGFKEAANHLLTRGRLFLDGFDLLRFEGDTVRVADRNHLARIGAFLSHRSDPIVFRTNSESERNRYFGEAFGDLTPSPIELVERCDNAQVVIVISDMVESAQAEILKAVAEKGKGAPRMPEDEDISGVFTTTVQKGRPFQPKLRRVLLYLYGGECCVCGIDVPTLLVTSHIVAVEDDPNIAADQRNALLLCALHDKAFESGIFGIEDDYTVVLNPNFSTSHPTLIREMVKREGKRISLPSIRKHRPLVEYLRRHREKHNIQ